MWIRGIWPCRRPRRSHCRYSPSSLKSSQPLDPNPSDSLARSQSSKPSVVPPRLLPPFMKSATLLSPLAFLNVAPGAQLYLYWENTKQEWRREKGMGLAKEAN